MKEKNYEDIINTKWPLNNPNRVRMGLNKRAKIFLPFAALKVDIADECKEEEILPFDLYLKKE